jgi:hypothetical protein
MKIIAGDSRAALPPPTAGGGPPPSPAEDTATVPKVPWLAHARRIIDTVSATTERHQASRVSGRRFFVGKFDFA